VGLVGVGQWLELKIPEVFSNCNNWFCDCRTDPSEINISDEMSKTTVWKALTMNAEKL